MRTADKARVGRLKIPTTTEGVSSNWLPSPGGCASTTAWSGWCWPWGETTGQYCKLLARSAERLDLEYVTVQSFVVARSGELDDLTRDKTDQRDAGLIADLACELCFNEVQLETGAWAELRSFAQARDRYRVDHRSALQKQRALLELTWSELLCDLPDLAGSHIQAMLRLGHSPLETAATSKARFSAQLRRAHSGCFRPWMAGRLWQAARLANPQGQSAGATLRLHLAGQRIKRRPGGRPPRRRDGNRLCPDRPQLAGRPGPGPWRRPSPKPARIQRRSAPAGRRPLHGQGGRQQPHRARLRRAAGCRRHPSPRRPMLRRLAHQAAVCLVRHNPDFEARFLALTRCSHHPLQKKRVYIAVANKLLRTLWSLAASGQPYQSQFSKAA